MIQTIRIENYKSVQKLEINPGRITVLIGENGSGKSNILEAIALGSAAAVDKLDNEFLSSRGIRVAEPQFMRAAFDKKNSSKEIKISFKGNNSFIEFELQNDNKPYSEWINLSYRDILKNALLLKLEKLTKSEKEILILRLNLLKNALFPENQKFKKILRHIKNFLIYSPESLSLNTFEKEGQIQPVGIRGEGLFKLLKVLSSESKEKINEIKKRLQLIDWFQDFEIPQNLFQGERYIRIKDRYMDESLAYFDQKSSNEGFLFLLFYFSLFISDLTPGFFAVDNIDASLNPKLCSRLIKELADLSEKYDKQAIFTTHNPAVLDGLNLDDEEQRLFVVFRNQSGYTKARRILKPKTPEGQEPVRLSEAFLRGYIGGLPKGF